MPSDEDPIRGRDPAPVPTVRELAMVLFRQRRVFVCVSGFVLAAAVLYAFVGTKYQANMKVLVRRGRADAPVSATENAPLDLTRMEVTEEELNSEVELLRDDEVLRRVVEETGTGGRDWFHFLRVGEGNAGRVERAARRLAQKLRVEPVKKTNLISISYAADDPQAAAKVLQSVASAYLGKAYGGASSRRRVAFLRTAARRIAVTTRRSQGEVAGVLGEAWSCGGGTAARPGAAKVE